MNSAGAITEDAKSIAAVFKDARGVVRATPPMASLVRGGLTVELADTICECNVADRLAAGERVVGYKVGFTNAAARAGLGFPDPMYGYIFETTVLASGSELPMRRYIAPWIEAEICFRLRTGIDAQYPTIDDVLRATDAVCGALEICDARVPDWRAAYADAIADNGYAGAIILSNEWCPPDGIDLVGELAELQRDGEPVGQGHGKAVMGNPAGAVAWLATRLALRGRRLEAGNLVMSGSLTPITAIERGRNYAATFTTLGVVELASI